MGEVLSLNNLVAVIALTFAVLLDLKTKKVDNRLVVSVFVLGTILQLIQNGAAATWPLFSSISIAVLIGLPLYMTKVFAGGDFKLLIAVATLLDWKAVALVSLTSLFWGAILGLLRTILQGDIKSVLQNLLSVFLRNKAHLNHLHSMPYTVAILFGFFTHLSLAQVGWRFL